MAKVKITISDKRGGGIEMKIESDPPFQNPENPKTADKPMTNAQMIAAQLFSAIVDDLKDSQNDPEG